MKFNFLLSLDRKRVIVTVIAVIAALIFLVLPISQQRILTRGIDSFETHRAIFGDHTVSQEITTQGEVVGIGAVLVDFYRAGQLQDAIVTIRALNTGQELGQTTIKATDIKDDQFARALFDKPINPANEKFLVEFSSRTATVKNPLGIRFNPQSDEDLLRYEDGRPGEGTLAIQIIERVPAWQYLRTTLHQDRPLWIRSISIIVSVLLVAVSGWQLQRNKLSPNKQASWRLLLIVMIAIIAFATRIDLILQLKGASGGDPYNYLFITQSIVNLENPFSNSKRLPGYPILLVPSYLLGSDHVLVMRTISAISASLSLIMLYLLIKKLRLPWPVQLIAPLLLAWQKDFFLVSTRPEPYAFYGLLLLCSLVLLYDMRRPWQQVAYGLVLGYAAMTRQEGFLLALVMGICSLFMWKNISGEDNWKSKKVAMSYIRMYLPALVLVLPFFISNWTQFGNPLYTPYFEGERLQIVDSWGSFKDSVGATWGVLGSMWKPSWDQLERFSIMDRPFLITAIIAATWGLLWPRVNTRELNAVKMSIIGSATLILVVVVYLSHAYQIHFSSLFPLIIAALLLISPIVFIFLLGWRSAPIILVLLTQILIATWFHPFSKHYQQSYPLIILLISVLLAAPLFYKSNKPLIFPHIFLASCLLAPFFLLQSVTFNRLVQAIDRANERTAFDYVAYEAIRSAKSLPGPHGIDEPHLPYRIYFANQTLFLNPEIEISPAEQEKWLADNNINTIMFTNNTKFFRELGDGWRKVFYNKSEGRDEHLYESWVYTRENKL